MSAPAQSSRSFTVNWTSSNSIYNFQILLINLRIGTTESLDDVLPPGATMLTVSTGLNGVDNYNVSVATVNVCGMTLSDPVTVYGEFECLSVNTNASFL